VDTVNGGGVDDVVHAPHHSLELASVAHVGSNETTVAAGRRANVDQDRLVTRLNEERRNGSAQGSAAAGDQDPHCRCSSLARV
jgi:hypothetical protein